MNNDTLITIAHLANIIAISILLIMIIVTFFTRILPVLRDKKITEEIKHHKFDLTDVYKQQRANMNEILGTIRFIGSFDHFLTTDEVMEYMKENMYDTLAMIYNVNNCCYLYDMSKNEWVRVEDDTVNTETTYEVIGPYLEKTERVPLEDIDRLIGKRHV